MLVCNCKHCFSPFKPSAELGKNALFCPRCLEAYNVAYGQIHQYIINNPVPGGYKIKDIGHISTHATVETLFVEQFFKEIELHKTILTQPDNTCLKCHQLLEPHQQKYCIACEQLIRQISVDIQDIQREMVQNRLQKGYGMRKSGRRSNRYGLSRDT